MFNMVSQLLKKVFSREEITTINIHLPAGEWDVITIATALNIPEQYKPFIRLMIDGEEITEIQSLVRDYVRVWTPDGRYKNTTLAEQVAAFVPQFVIEGRVNELA